MRFSVRTGGIYRGASPGRWVGDLGGPGLSGRPELLVMVGAIPCWTLLYEIHNAPRALRFRMAAALWRNGGGCERHLSPRACSRCASR